MSTSEAEQHTIRVLEVYRGALHRSEMTTWVAQEPHIGAIKHRHGGWYECDAWSPDDGDADFVAFMVPALPSTSVEEAVKAANEALKPKRRRGRITEAARGAAHAVRAVGLVAWEVGRLAIEAVTPRRRAEDDARVGRHKTTETHAGGQ